MVILENTILVLPLRIKGNTSSNGPCKKLFLREQVCFSHSPVAYVQEIKTHGNSVLNWVCAMEVAMLGFRTILSMLSGFTTIDWKGIPASTFRCYFQSYHLWFVFQARGYHERNSLFNFYSGPQRKWQVREEQIYPKAFFSENSTL